MSSHYKWLFATIIAVCGTAGPVEAQSSVRINEFMAANVTAVPEFVDFGDYEDWIEFYNLGGTAVDVSRYTLTDDVTEPTKWTFPPGSTIEPAGYFLVWADDRNVALGVNRIRPWWPGDVRFTTRWNHTNFQLNRTAETIFLFDTAGVLVDSVSYGHQPADVSRGRQPDGTGMWMSFGEATPLSQNDAPPLEGLLTAADVVISPPAGRYTGSVVVSIAQTGSGGTLHYTTDGSRPTRGSPEYVSPLTINRVAVIRARVLADGRIPGRVASSTYLVGTDHDLPVVTLATDPKLLWDANLGIYRNSLKEREAPISFEFFPGSSRTAQLDAGVRIGGENIFRFAEKPFNLYFRSEYGTSHLVYRIFDQLPFLSWNRLYLRNGGDDWPHTMMRDGFQATLLSGLEGNAVQAYRPTVLYLNGEYWGIYNLRQKIDEHFFRLHHGVIEANLDHLESDARIIAGDSTAYVAMLNYAAGHDLRVAEDYAAVTDQLDLASLMDFVIAQSFVANSSWEHNREMWRDRGGDSRWRWVNVDMDRGYDINRVGSAVLTEIINEFGLFGALTANSAFRDTFVGRYAMHLNTTFQPERALETIDSLAGAIASEIPAHSERWGTYIDSLSIPRWGIEPGIASYESWLSSVDDMRRFARQRPTLAAQQVVSYFDLAGMATLSLETAPARAGRLQVNGFDVSPGDALSLFQGVPMTVAVEPAPGYSFRHWTERTHGGMIVLLPRNASWNYLDGGSTPPTGWSESGFDDSAWHVGAAELGYGDGDEATVVSYGSDDRNKPITTYFRKTFDIVDPGAYSGLLVDLVRDDGALLSLNGTEIVRSNLPAGEITPITRASTVVSGADESRVHRFETSATLLVAGTNVLAVEIHQVDGLSSDISFDVSLSALLADPTTHTAIVGESPSLRYVASGEAVLTAVFDTETIHRLGPVVSSETRLMAAESPYLVEGVVTINSGIALTIDAGVVLSMLPEATLDVRGSLVLNGTKSNPVTLQPYFPSRPWGAVCLSGASTAVFEHVDISGAAGGGDPGDCPAALSADGASLQIVGGSFSDVALPIYARESTVGIDGVRFGPVNAVGDYVTADGGTVEILNSVFDGNFLEDMDAIDLGFLLPGSVVANNVIRDFAGPNSDGIDLGDGSRDVLIEGNRITNVADKGISIGQGSSGILSRNVIARTSQGVGIKDSLSYAEIRQCTFLQNVVGVAVFEKNPGRGGAHARINSTLFAQSTESDLQADHLSTVQVTFSLSDAPLPGSSNLHLDPLLLDPANLNVHLQVFSPAIDAGDAAAVPDPDGSRADIGAMPFAGFRDGEIVINEINYHSSDSFDPEDWVELYNRTGFAVDLTSWVLVDGGFEASFVFETGVSLAEDGHLVVARNPDRFANLFPAAGPLFGPLRRGLGGNGDAVHLYDATGSLVDSLMYADAAPWPAEPDGMGPTLELISPQKDNADPLNWAASSGFGTPGERNSVFSTARLPDPGAYVPASFALSPTYPNPSSTIATIQYEVPEPSYLTLHLVDLLGRRVQTLTDGSARAGTYMLRWDTSSFPSGVYILSMAARTDRGARMQRVTRTVVLAR